MQLTAEVKHSVRVHRCTVDFPRRLSFALLTASVATRSSAVLCLDTHPEQGVFVTGGKDGLVKV